MRPPMFGHAHRRLSTDLLVPRRECTQRGDLGHLSAVHALLPLVQRLGAALLAVRAMQAHASAVVHVRDSGHRQHLTTISTNTATYASAIMRTTNRRYAE